jgi:hypothetical protein
VSLVLLVLSYGLSAFNSNQWRSGKAEGALNKALESSGSSFRVELLHPGSPKRPLNQVQQNIAELQKVLSSAKQSSTAPKDLKERFIPLWQALMAVKHGEGDGSTVLEALKPYFHNLGLKIVLVNNLDTQA